MKVVKILGAGVFGYLLLSSARLLAAEGLEAAASSTESLIKPMSQSGFLVASILTLLITISIATWAIACAKVISLRKQARLCEEFADAFEASNSLEVFNRTMADFSSSPLREVFRASYKELGRCRVRIGQKTPDYATIGLVLDNVGRSLEKARTVERQGMERFLALLAISASVSPFIGLFGTVWGIIGAFDGIARSGSASLAAVAPGISEALVATAFGLAAAIPAAVGYNFANNLIRKILTVIDTFAADFLNMVEGQVAQHGVGTPASEGSAASKIKG